MLYVGDESSTLLSTRQPVMARESTQDKKTVALEKYRPYNSSIGEFIQTLISQEALEPNINFSSIMSKMGVPASSVLFLCVVYNIGCLLQAAQVIAATDPVEVAVIKSLSEKWNIDESASWNLTDPCFGPANTNATIDNPGIKCNCTKKKGTICHVRQIKVSMLDKTGELPEVLANLTYLNDLNLYRNYFSGRIPAFLGNLTNLQHLSLGTNNFLGPVPKELGKLRKLIELRISSTNLNGTLPPEFGNLTRLENLYIDSAGLTGEIPSTFRNLQKLKIVSASDNLFTGAIPDFIGNWTDLNELKIQGTTLEGPIPSSFSNLTSLRKLILRNNKISGEIPSFVGELSKLHYLDLSFNNFTGEFPTSLQNLKSLRYLFLGNNNLSGRLPSQLSSSLMYIDLSYNQFSGTLPAWSNGTNLKINLVGNYLQINVTNNRLSSSGLACLQRTFPCNKQDPRYSQFAINCGGSQITSQLGIDYESDNETLDAASFSVSDTQNWGVSNTGNFLDNEAESFTQSSLSQFTKTLNTELYQTARLSPGSLRYFGLGLQNGRYTVELQFAELEFTDVESWKNLGKRIFDVYVQGNKVLSNFNIQKLAGGSFIAVDRNFSTSVTENFLEIHLFWAGKGTCCVTKDGTYGPLISAISVTPEFKPAVSDLPHSDTHPKKMKTGAVIGIVFGGMVAVLICLIFIIFWRKSLEARGQEQEALKGLHTKPNIFSYADIKNATSNFHEENKLGQGGFGVVHKGILPDGKLIAVKQLSAESKQGKREFLNEVAVISAVQHRNLVKLHGCCVEGEHRILVYELLENNSLEQALFGNERSEIHLDWPTRHNICINTARGLAYLHEESSVRIVHRDIKPSNILLDDSLNPKIADFGLAKLFDESKSHFSTRVAGTIGYLAPEYAMRGHLTEKADVFSFGVVALEVVSGRSNTDTTLPQNSVYLLEWAWQLHEQNSLLELMDPELRPTCIEEEVLRLIAVALLCTQALPAMRPPMSRVVAMLTGDVEEIPIVSRPGYITDWQYNNYIAAQSTEIAFTVSTPQQRSTEIILPAALFSTENEDMSPSMIRKALDDGL
ncbi:probable LRR receptor-like serine/threonine-protein kinase At1g56130 isoform X2 [Cryptomeria japonica]|uniref:probable LRR receptor-like serine/threonine-protein kinase At1g56130 isoform X2 n=1 Tax=Cryptomeria japonica TaxID=3369 RepID=UPI0027DA2880|nr:probable LRR receptor-like serine/threonine-protein kinase At1g56130 isoform X2 [Cryptomeria japonica]